MLAHLVLIEHGADRERDLGLPRERLPLASDGGLDAGEVALGGGQQILALAGALGGELGVAADDQPLAREVGGGDAGHVALVEQRELQGAAVEQRLDRRGAQGGDPVEPGGLEVLGDARLGDHAAVADQHDVIEARTAASVSRPGWLASSDRRCCRRTPRSRPDIRRARRAGHRRSASVPRRCRHGCSRVGRADSSGPPCSWRTRRRAPACRSSDAVWPAPSRWRAGAPAASRVRCRARPRRHRRDRAPLPGWRSPWPATGRGRRRASKPGSRMRPTIMARTRSRQRLPSGPRMRSRPILRAVPSAAATWPCGSERVMVKASGPGG